MARYGLFSDIFLRPRGVPGRLGGWVMSRTSNRLPGEVVASLDLAPYATVLEIGCGPGLGIEAAVARLPRGKVLAAEPSKVMRQQAAHRNARHVAAGRVEIQAGRVERLPFADASLDAAFSTNSFQLWPDPLRALTEIRRTLKPRAPLVVAVSRYAWPLRHRSIAVAMRNAGFSNVEELGLPSAREALRGLA